MKKLLHYTFNDLEKDYNVDYSNWHGLAFCGGLLFVGVMSIVGLILGALMYS